MVNTIKKIKIAFPAPGIYLKQQLNGQHLTTIHLGLRHCG